MGTRRPLPVLGTCSTLRLRIFGFCLGNYGGALFFGGRLILWWPFAVTPQPGSDSFFFYRRLCNAEKRDRAEIKTPRPLSPKN